MSLVQYHLTIDDRAKGIKARALPCIWLGFIILLLAFAQPVWAGSAPEFNTVDQITLNLANQLVTLPHSRHIAGHILVVNFVDLSQLGCTSSFGQLMAERLRNLLAQKGWQVLETRRGDKVKIEEDAGPYILSDQVKDLAKKIHCTSVLLGTYLYHQGTITVNAKLVAVPDNSILSAATAEDICTPYIFALLRPIGFGCRSPQAVIRIKPFSKRRISQDEPATSYVGENYFKEDNINENP